MNWRLMERFRQMQEEMDKLFEDFFSSERFGPSFLALPSPEKQPLQRFQPARFLKAYADLYETDKEVIAQFDLPGFDKNDIDIKISDNNLTVKVEKKAQKEEKAKGYYLSERSYAGFYRCISLPPYLKPDQAKAEYKNGVLTISIPKDEKKLKENEIKIKVY
ncbi:MAG: Hsp20/alpha crystallin family protein [Candidatus Micrarchaeota archaeon]|nr:Hsp20/alpha crystallin family protein [Candidatus Micrarchaeota archaeon]